MRGRSSLLLLSGVGVSAVLAVVAWASGGGPPRYHACSHVSIGFRTPVYAHNVSCGIAKTVVKRCSAPKRTCFGALALPYHGKGEPYLPQAPSYKPLGFECYQVWGSYTAGLPPPPTNLVPDPKAILCYRQASKPGPIVVIYQQLVAYIV